MKKRIWALIVSIMVFIGAVPGLPVFADGENVTLHASYGGTVSLEYNGAVEKITSSSEGEYSSVSQNYGAGETMILTATPNDGYYFIGWSTSTSDELVFDKNPTYSFTISASKTYEIYALFGELITVTFHFGTVENPDILETVQVKATPGSMYGEITSDAGFLAADAELAKKYGSETEWMDMITYRPLKVIASEGSYKETDVVAIGDDTIWENTDIYVAYMFPITSVNVTLDPPIAGKTNETIPVITVPESANYRAESVIDEPAAPYWFDPENTDEAYDVTFECGKTYYARFFLEAKIGYYFDLSEEGVTVNNSKPYSVDETGCITWWMEASVTLEHDWGEWEPATQATATEPGIMTRTCLECNHTETKEYTLETASTTDNNSAVQPVEDKPEGEQGTAQPAFYIADSVHFEGENGTSIWSWNPDKLVWGTSCDSLDWDASPTGMDDHAFHIVDNTGARANIRPVTIEDLAKVTVTNDTTGRADQLNAVTVDGDGSTISFYDDGDGRPHQEAPLPKVVIQCPTFGSMILGALWSGSIIIDLYPSYLNTLEPGTYTLTAYFVDGSSVSTKFNVYAGDNAAADTTKAATTVPSTGEGISNTMIWGAVLVSLSVISIGVVLDKKRLGKRDVK